MCFRIIRYVPIARGILHGNGRVVIAAWYDRRRIALFDQDMLWMTGPLKPEIVES